MNELADNRHDDAAELEERCADLEEAMKALTERERFVLTERFHHKRTMASIAADLKRSPTLVNQIVHKALNRLERKLSVIRGARKIDDERLRQKHPWLERKIGG